MAANDCIAALASPIGDYEDAIIERVASRTEMDYIVTRRIARFGWNQAVQQFLEKPRIP